MRDSQEWIKDKFTNASWVVNDGDNAGADHLAGIRFQDHLTRSRNLSSFFKARNPGQWAVVRLAASPT
jgi:hypothetical protein